MYISIDCSMYGLPQAGKIANDQLKKRLAESGYHPAQFTPRLWTHVWRPIKFTLVVDDFGVKFTGDKHANHLKKALKRYYKVTVEWKGEKCVGMNLKWDYKKRRLETSVPGFVASKLHKYQHPKPTKPQHSSSNLAPIQYGANIQESTPTDTSPQLLPAEIKRIQDIVGTFFW